MHHYAVNFQVSNRTGQMQRLDVQQKDGPMATAKAEDTNLAGRSRLQRFQAPAAFAVEYDFP